jgi:energy-converting hydrogenase Eha subunit A
MVGKSSYFGKNNIRPDFAQNAQNEPKSAADFLRHTEKNAENDTPTSSNNSSVNTAKNRENFRFTGSGKPALNIQKSSKKGRFSLKKSSPAMVVVGAIILCVMTIFAIAGNLGNQIETLITRATDTMFGSYSENTLRITEELLAGERGNFPEYLEKRLKNQGVTVSSAKSGYVLNWGTEQITAKNFREHYKNDIKFREAFSSAKRGRVSNFYDVAATAAFTRLGISRNLYRSYKQTGDEKVDRAAYKKTESDLFEGKTNSSINTVSESTKTDEKGNTTTEKAKTGENISNKGEKGNSRARAKSYLSDISSRVADTANVACAALKVGNLVSISIAAAETYSAINYFMSNIENVSKTKAGEGNAAAQNQFLNFLNEPTTTTYTDVETGEEKEVTGAPIQAEGFANVLAGTSPNLNKTKNYSVESAFTTTATAIGLTAATHKICGGVRAVSATISIAVGVLSGGIVKTFASLAKTTIINLATQQAIAGTLSALVPKIAKSLFENTADSLTGIPAGETFVKGAALGNKKLSRSTSGQMLADRATATSYARQTQIANASESELSRSRKNQFDTSSPDTFLGKITSKLTIVASSNNLLKTIANFTSITKTNLASLLDYASLKTYADDGDNTAKNALNEVDYSTIFADESTCQNLTDIGAACGAYGEEITATSPEVQKISSNDPKYREALKGNVRRLEDGTYEVVPNSLLAKKIMYCDERDSPFGVYDSNIANAFETSLGFGDSIPILNDAIDILNAVEEMSPETEGWARGSYCVMNKETNPYYKQLIYLQHFTEDQRIASQMELDETRKEDGTIKNPTLAYKEAYYEKNPIDTSPTGLLARYTGSTKKEAEAVIALIEYSNFLAEYEPPVEKKPEYHYHHQESILKETYQNIVSKVEYENLRSRSFAV